MVRLSKRVGSLQESPIRKLDLLVKEQENVTFHRINIGQPDVPTPAPVLDALNGWRPDVIAYGPASGTFDTREAAAKYFQRWSPGINWKDVAITTGGSEALLFAFAALGDPGDEILVPEPYYTNYNGFAQTVGLSVRPIATRLEDDFAIPPDHVLDSMITEKTRAIVFSNPANPTGTVYGRETLERLLAWAKRNNIVVVADEVYRRIYFREPPVSALQFPEYADRVIVVDSMSKTWSACGMRIGFLISRNATIMDAVERLGQARLGPQPMGQVGAVAALELPDSYYEDIRKTYEGRVFAAYEALKTIPGVQVARPDGAFYMMLGLPVDSAESFARFLITDFRHEGESVVVAPAGGFYADPERGKTQVRIAAVIEEAKMARAADLLRRALDAYNA